MGHTALIVLLAGALATPVCQARDLPRGRDQPRPTGCERYGPDFVKLEGSDTCVRLSGHVRVEGDVIGGGRAAGSGGLR